MTVPARYPVTRYVLKSPPSGELFEFSRSSRTDPEGRFRFVYTLAPGKQGPGEHIHPHEAESFECLSGRLHLWIDDAFHDLGPGDAAVVPAGSRHRFTNPGPEPTVCNVWLDGPRMEDTFVPMAVAEVDAPSIRNMIRFIATMPVHDASVATPRLAATISSWVVRVVQLFGVQPFQAVSGWDVEQA